ncbi:MAG: phosphatase PAP2 family protein [Patescibacteria group bacterium]
MLLHLDNQIFDFIHLLSGRFLVLDWFGIFCAKYLMFVMIAVFIIWWLELKRTRPSENWPVLGKRKWLDLFAVVLSVIVGIILNYIISFIHFRVRPFILHDVALLIGFPLSTKSFPSDHSAFAFALALSFWFYNKRLGYIFLVLACFVGLGRIFVGVHYPIDVVVGAVVGILSALIIRWVFLKTFLKE